MSSSETILVVGAGLMGHGIAQVFAVHGHSVLLYDSNVDVLFTAKERIKQNLTEVSSYNLVESSAVTDTLNRVQTTDQLDSACADVDIVIEAVSENLNLKQSIFAKLDALCPPTTILCSNTSVISITQIAATSQNRSRILGTHWWNPPYLVPLVEIIRTDHTADWCMAKVFDVLKKIGKMPVYVQKDIPGFVGNRLQHALWREAFDLIDNGVCDAATVDEVIRQGFGLRLPFLGPVVNADLIGLDLTLSIHEYILPHLCTVAQPSTTLQSLVADSHLGMKSGKGFLSWSAAEADEKRAKLNDYLMNRIADMQ